MIVQMEGVSFQYDKTPALCDIQLEIPQGSLTVLCGITGSGKSTLLRLISGLVKPSTGSISYGGDVNPKRISMVFQQPETQLFASSVYKDIEYGLEQHGVPKASRSELIQSALAKVGLPFEEYSERSPFLLSGGEKRRLCIAGAIAVQPRLLILDEPTAGLDPPAAQALLELVQKLQQSGLTIVTGTHDLDAFFPIADQAVVMSQGSVYYSGPIHPLTTDPAKLSAAGLEPPAYVRIGATLKEKGLIKKTPASLEDVLTELQAHPLAIPVISRNIMEVVEDADADVLPTEDNRFQAYSEVIHSKTTTLKSRWQERDPRVKWLGMVLGSFIILGMHSLLPLLLTTGIIAGLLGSAGLSWARTVWFFKPFLLMFLFLWILSAITWSSPDYSLGPIGFTNEGIILGGLSVLRFLLLVAIGFLFTETTTGAPLREGLEWAIAPLKKLGIRTRNVSLAVSITLQFVPWILGKLSQLQLALRSRGRQQNKLKQWTPRQIYMLLVPLLILVISMGDELATAIESRGYDSKKDRTPTYALIWRRSDTLSLICILLVTGLLWWCSLAT
ncbi:ATP-binding cassette domain-containing protein [Paenibacillus monticola]|uniref:ATP-binding cassette domain-containing protein n=1 Tax=Paenibacillus monticola TaxID=2666075 RepID=A0A7X2H5Y5_9BACL|nr:ATP-binding cassette domain-containing protein [Paenibacillus monticola]MRN54132.1 ATP-binding cassette domain-containing protein [Paenibacillus monticola]